ncbi:MAG: hypothetical protein ACLPJH_17390 [Myxococcaceae bacterium]
MGGVDVTAAWLQLLACPMCAEAQASRVAVLLPFIIGVPYVVSAVIIHLVRRLA